MKSEHFFKTFLLLIILIPASSSVSFDFERFEPNMPGMVFQGDAYPANGVIQVTKNQRDGSLTRSVGRAAYWSPVRIWDRKTGELSDFSSHFTFTINALNSSFYGDGLAFFLAPFQAGIPPNSAAGYLGLFRNTTSSPDPNPALNQVVAVEFDTFKDVWDPSSDHVGIDINSIESVTYVDWKNSIKTGARGNAWVTYDSATKNLSVFLTYVHNPVFSNNSTVSHIVDLREILPETVQVGFSAATGELTELHTILSWSFTSSLDSKKPDKRLLVGLSIGIPLFLCVLFLAFYIRWIKVKSSRRSHLVSGDSFIDEDLQRGAGPRQFTFWELSRATNHFSEAGRLGEGGFGVVYKGVLGETSLEVAVKRVSRGSKQGRKEYASEIRVISRLRHRNLVQLIGWCHEKDEFLLVYEYMPNGSLDSHLFGSRPALTWPVRYSKIALGLASALLYLHEEWEQCVVHRDIKSSNVMLDSNYNVKLGDFGLARLVDHELGSQTTILAGTMGYLAPECVTTGKASKESDVYSFGVVALEIASGRRPVEPKLEPGKVRLVEWVWDLYGQGTVLEAADEGLNKMFHEKQMECLLVVGLWCCHPDHRLRPSIKQVINTLNFESPLPKLPPKLPMAMYFAPPMSMCRFSYTSSADLTASLRHRAHCLCNNCGTGSTLPFFSSSARALLTSHEVGLVRTPKTFVDLML